MKELSRDKFNDLLKTGNSYLDFYEEVSNDCYLISFPCHGRITTQKLIWLQRTERFFIVDVAFMFRDRLRYFDLLHINEITVDEYMDLLMDIDKEFTEVFYKLRSLTI